MDWKGKGVQEVIILSPVYLTYIWSRSWDILGWMNHKLESRFPEEISTTSGIHDTTLIAESKEKLKSLLMRVKGEWNSWIVKNSAFKKLRSWHPVPSFQSKENGEKWKQWQILFSWAPKSLHRVSAAMKLKDSCFLEENYNKHRHHAIKQGHHFADKGPNG